MLLLEEKCKNPGTKKKDFMLVLGAEALTFQRSGRKRLPFLWD